MADSNAAETLDRAATELRHEGITWMTVLGDVLAAEAIWATDRGNHYPADRAPMLRVAEAYLEGLTADG